MQNRCSIYGNHCHTFLSIGSYFTHTHHQPSIAVDAASARAKSDSESDCKDAESWKNSIKNFCAIWIRYGRQIAFLQRTRASIGFTVVIRTHTTHPDTIHNTQRVLENDRQRMEQRQSERQRDREREIERGRKANIRENELEIKWWINAYFTQLHGEMHQSCPYHIVRSSF